MISYDMLTLVRNHNLSQLPSQGVALPSGFWPSPVGFVFVLVCLALPSGRLPPSWPFSLGFFVLTLEDVNCGITREPLTPKVFLNHNFFDKKKYALVIGIGEGQQWKRATHLPKKSRLQVTSAFIFFIFHFVYFFHLCFPHFLKFFFFFNSVHFIFLYSFKNSICTEEVSFVVGAPWRCGVLTAQGGIAGIGLGHLMGREHDSTPQSEVEAPRLLSRSLPRLDCCCCRCCWLLVVGRRLLLCGCAQHTMSCKSDKQTSHARNYPFT